MTPALPVALFSLPRSHGTPTRVVGPSGKPKGHEAHPGALGRRRARHPRGGLPRGGRAVYRARHGPDARLSEVFDLVGGTSTGALIAAAIALGREVAEIREFYLVRATRVFRTGRWWQFGLAPVFDARRLEAEIRREFGDVTLGAPELQTFLAIVMKRLDTGSPWIVSNIPHAPFYDDPEDGGFIGNRHLPLARLVNAVPPASAETSSQPPAMSQTERKVL